jgi:hypothetical protein
MTILRLVVHPLTAVNIPDSLQKAIRAGGKCSIKSQSAGKSCYRAMPENKRQIPQKMEAAGR